MEYRPFQNLKLSRLGFGSMRLPLQADGHTVDLEKSRALLEAAYRGGVNYFDCAYSYLDGQSEPVVASILRDFPRDTWYLATKMPGHEINPRFNPRAIFEEQLRRCQTDYFDFYLLHNVYDKSVETYMDEKLGIIRYLQEQKAAGKIRHLGFSSHATVDVLRRFLDRYDGVFEFVQIQLNYLDWSLQDAKKKYELLQERGLPIIVMEPCRGGKLSNLPESVSAELQALRPGASDSSWAFRFLQDLPGVQLVLSGMNQMEQLEDNLRTFSAPAPLSEAERACLQKAVAVLEEHMLPCTGCRYCCRSCPQKLDIPHLLKLYNDISLGSTMIPGMLIDSLPEEKRPQSCIACGNCRKVCPQGIDVPEMMKRFSDLLKTIPHWEDISKERAKQHVY